MTQKFSYNLEKDAIKVIVQARMANQIYTLLVYIPHILHLVIRDSSILCIILQAIIFTGSVKIKEDRPRCREIFQVSAIISHA